MEEHEIAYLDIDKKIVNYQPLLIMPVIVNAVFALDVLSLICCLLGLIFYAVFNLKGVGSQYKVLSSLFLLPTVIGFFSFAYDCVMLVYQILPYSR